MGFLSSVSKAIGGIAKPAAGIFKQIAPLAVGAIPGFGLVAGPVLAGVISGTQAKRQAKAQGIKLPKGTILVNRKSFNKKIRQLAKRKKQLKSSRKKLTATRNQLRTARFALFGAGGVAVLLLVMVSRR